MRKIWNKIRKIFASIGLALFVFGTRVIAATLINQPTEMLYGPAKPEKDVGRKDVGRV